MTLGISATLLGVPLVSLSGTVGSAVAPAAGGTSSTGVLDVGAGLGTGVGVTAAGSVSDVTATRTASQSSSSATIAGVNIGVLGLNAVQTGVVQAQAVCPAGGTPTANASVTDLVLLGSAVTLNATTPTVTVGAAVNVAGLVGARLGVTAQRIVTTTATGATATAVQVALSLTATVGLPTTLNLGTITLASANCTAPNAAASSLSPTSGPTHGGTPVTITGAGLQNTTGVNFGSTPAASFTASADGTTVTAVAPASETAGAVAVTLIRPTGNLTPGNFTYIAPTLTAVAPPQGTTAGGTQVTLTGTGLLGATGVTFGGTAGTIVGTPTETSITVTTPAHAAGAVNVVAVLPGADATITNGYTYVTPTAPIITSFTPVQGPAAGGTTVTFTGNNLANVSAVTFGGTAATVVGTPTATSLTVTTPAHAVGPVDVVLTNPGGTTTAATQFTYLNDGSGATFTGITPANVPTSGGSTITIAGTGLAGATGVTVNNVPATNVVSTGTSVTATVPASETAGAATVAVQFPAGSRTAGTITYVAPTLTAVNPATGPSSGGTTLTLTGTGLAPVTSVTVGGSPATIVGTPTATTITVTTAAHAPGLVDVVAVLPGADATATGAFTYLDDGTGATVTGVSPATSPTSGGGTITVSGSGLGAVTGLTVGGVTVGNLTVAPDGTSVTGTIPATQTAGSAPVVLTFPAGTTVTAGSLVYVAPAITAVTPSQGPDDGGTAVTLTGSGFTGATQLLLDGTAIPFTEVSDTEITFTTPAHAAGPVDLTVVLPGLDATAPGGFAFLPEGVATVSAVNPNEGPTSGGTTVTLTGTDLDTVSAVLFDGTAGTIVGTPTGTSLIVTSPAHPQPGPVTLTLTNEGGDSWVPGGFTYLADGTAAVVTSITPAEVPTAGGVTVTIDGSGFSGATGITVGGEPATDVVVAADGSSITFTVPATEDAGQAPVVIEFPLGNAAAGPITYVAPSIDTIDPIEGPISGGTTVTLTGTGLERATGVTFAGTAATDLTVVGPGEITVTTPAQPAGAVDVVVQLPGADAVATDGYTYLVDGSEADVTDVSPAELPTSGGTVTITGTGLTGATAVTVGGVALTDLDVSDTAITGTLPPSETAGEREVVITYPAGTVDAGTITLVAPTLTTVSPTFGVSSGGNTLTLTGSGLTGATAVLVGGEPAPILTNSDTSITVTAPAHTPGVVDIVVELPGADATLPLAYTYLDDGTGATVTGIAPTEVSTAGGAEVTVTGTGLQNVFGVTVGGVLAEDPVVSPDGTTVTFVVPSAEVAGPATVSLWFPAGTVVAGQIAYVGPTITGIDPAQGPTSGGTEVTVTGTGLAGATQVLVDSEQAEIVSASDTEVVFTTPAGVAGPADVVVVLPGADATATDGFTYLEDGSGVDITDVSPTSSPTAGGGTLTVTGTGLGSVTGVTIGGVAATDLVVNGAGTELTVTIPASDTAGPAPIVLTVPAGTVNAGDLTYVAPTLTGVAPTEGPAAGGTDVVLTGSGFTGADTLTIGGVDVPFTVVSDTQITFTTPEHAPGAVTIVVGLPGADATLDDAFTYLDDGSGATITNVTPTTSSTVGGGTLTITGTGLGGATGVTIGGTDAADFAVNAGGTSITVTIPASDAAGPAPIVITFPAGEVSAGDLTYLAPELTGIDPAVGPTSGGTLVTLTGSGFTGATGVTFGGSAGVDFTLVSDTEITVLTPSHAEGVVDVVIQLPGADATLADGFEYQADATGVVVDTISPATSPVAGGGTLTITGTGLDAVTAVTIGDVTVTDVTVNGDGTELTLTIPPSEVTGQLPVTLTTAGGDVLAGGLTYVGSTVTALVPVEGPVVGGTEVEVTGTDLGAVTGVLVDGVPATAVTATATTVTFTTPEHAAGAVTIVLTQPGLDVTLTDAFTYLDDGSAATITGLSPTTVPLAGGPTVTITGTGLDTATGVTVDGVTATDVVVAPDGTSITFTAPPGSAAGTATVEVTFPAGQIPAGDLTYLDDGSQATIDGIDPSTVPLAGGTTVTITGTGLQNATGVTAGGFAGTDVVVAPDGTSITFTAPPGTEPGAVAVVVEFPAGDIPAGDLTYADDGSQATIDGIDPSTVPLAGGTTVTITGTGLQNATGVTVGGADATDVVVAPDGTSITFTAPPGTAVGTEPVEVTFPAGQIPAGDLTYADDGSQATIGGIDPSSVPLSGGTTVTITGTGLQNATGVTVGGTDATDVVVAPDGTSITFTAPPGTEPGAEPVVVTFPAGELPAGNLTYLDDGSQATVSGIDPSTVPLAGGTTVTITGTGLQNATGVTVGGADATDVVVAPDGTSITFTAPPGADLGAVPVVVTFPAGELPAGDLTYADDGSRATVASLTPAMVPTYGGDELTITGTGLQNVTGVTINDLDATDLVVANDGTSVTVAVPPSEVDGPVSVVLAFPAGTLSAGELTYEPPAIYQIEPAQGPDEGGTTVTITGGNLAPATEVLFDGIPGTDLQVESPMLRAVATTLTVVAPEHEPGLVDITVVLPGEDAELDDGYGYLADDGPTIESIDPGTGPTAGGTTVTLTGTGLDTLSAVTFDGLPATIVSTSAATAVVTTPAHAVGPVDVAFTNADGTTVLPRAFTYVDETNPGGGDDPVVITGYTPRVGPTSGGQTVTITGSGFLPGDTVVTFGGAAATVTVLSGDALLAVTPPHAVGTVPLIVTAGTQTSPTLTYQYVDDPTLPGPPVVTGANPTTIPSSGGIPVTVTGSGFVPGQTGVYICGVLIPADQVTVSADGTSLTFTAPPCDPGAVTVTVITPGGTSALTLYYVSDALYAAGRAANGLNPWRLALTGANTGGTPWAALLLVAAGAGLLLTRRTIVLRRHRSAVPPR